ncbi:MAG: HepT-like ribonuclease domain-containing protein [Propionivibrio sp.]
MSPDDRWRVCHMVDAAEQALAFVQTRNRGDLDGDPMLRMALTRAVEIVGEAASQVSEAGRTEFPAVPWPQIVGMRNRLVHAYFDINQDVLWDTVQLALPALLAQLRALLEKE